MHVMDALGNDVRRELLEILRQGPTPVGQLAAAFDISRPAISRHLRILQGAHLIRHEQVGRQNLYSIDPQGFESARAYLESFWDEALVRFKLVAENLENP